MKTRVTPPELVCSCCGGSCDECGGLIRREETWWCSHCWSGYNDPALDCEAAEERRRQRIIEEQEAQA